jgi:hypothetical protein
MTRKDYVLLAHCLHIARGAATEAERSGIELAARLMAAKLAGENARFDAPRFLQACGVTP